jgi:prepilin-type N-terminal cleavage/methylation domain-containing protein
MRARRTARPGRARGTGVRRGLRAGFTLVELMVAMMIFTIGLLAMASTAAVVVRQMGDSSRMGVAAAVAQNQMEQLYAGNCKIAQSGSSVERGVSIAWTITPATRAATLGVSVTYQSRRGLRTQTYQSTVACA